VLIIVVDDQHEAATTLARLLNRCGFQATAVSCGEKLFEQLHSIPSPSLIILDLTMPVMDGMECLKQIRATPELQGIPVLMYSADFSFERMQQARRLGAQDYVVKGTMQWDEFLGKIKSIIAAAAA